jgi:hypothetical protein
MKITLSHTMEGKTSIREFVDGSKEQIIKGMVEIEEMLGEKPDCLPRTVLLHSLFKQQNIKKSIWENLVVRDVEKNSEGELWILEEFKN